jgi:adenylate cyclase
MQVTRLDDQNIATRGVVHGGDGSVGGAITGRARSIGAMPEAAFHPDGITVEVRPGETLLDAALRAEIPHAHACGGDGVCSTCRVLVVDGLEHCTERTGHEEALVRELRFTPATRLACQTGTTGDVVVRRLVVDARDVQFADARRQPGPRAVGEERRLAVLFADLRSFTPLTDALLPYDVIYILRRCFTDAFEIVAQRHGEVTSFMGDGLMAVFGLERPEQAATDAVRAGLDLLAMVKRRTPRFEALYQRAIEMNIGIHVGPTIVGDVGSIAGSPVFTAVGDTVNVARRIEEANKRTGTRLLVSGALAAEAGAVLHTGEAFRVELTGKPGRHDVIEVVGMTASSSS